MTLRGQAAIVGIGELPTRRTYPGRTTYSLCAEATRLAITDAGLRKEDIMVSSPVARTSVPWIWPSTWGCAWAFARA